MRATTTFSCVLAAAATLGAAMPLRQAVKVDTRSPSVETAGASGADDDDAIAYAWFAEDDEHSTTKRGAMQISDQAETRSVEGAGASGTDDDDAIAYAWFAEDDGQQAKKRGVEGAGASGADDDDAIAYAWFAEDEE